MSAEYTPTTEHVRQVFQVDPNRNVTQREQGKAFDRWLEKLIAQVRVDTLRDAAAQARKGWEPDTCPWVGFLDDRADRIEGAS